MQTGRLFRWNLDHFLRFVQGHEGRAASHLEQVRGLLGHTPIETTQIYAQIQPRQLKQAVSFYESRALDVLI